MKYEIKGTKIKDLIKIIVDRSLDLSPSYQRNFIWSKNDQSSLIETILKGYPLPSLFIYENPNGKFEMVDGQQRTRTIYRFYKGEITSSSKKTFKPNEDYFLNYLLPIVFISDLEKEDSLNEFYVLINKKGKALNSPEVNRAEFHDHPFLSLADEALNIQSFIDLGIFSEATSKRMNDRAFVEELLAYLLFGITDKKAGVEMAFKNSELVKEKYKIIKSRFESIVEKINALQRIAEISSTRYRQKNDFYTFFNYVDKHNYLKKELLEFQYKILLLLNQKDENDNQFISPSNEDCEALRSYALNCVSQSNSKKARENRLEFFENILLNKDISANSDMQDVLSYLTEMFGKKKTNLIEINGFQLIDVNSIS